MEQFILAHEGPVRLAAFAGIFIVVALAEIAAPRRRLALAKGPRWLHNILLVVFNTLVLRVVFVTAAVGLAALVEELGWGLFNNVDLPRWLIIVLAVIILDFVIYLQHVMVHAIPGLWKLHMVHHADLDYDVTTGARFHPVEIIFSMLIKMTAILALGPPAVAVVIFEVLLNGTAMFNHGNLKLPLGLDRVLRLFVVTPDMHRVHHSTDPAEANSNFGFNLPWWDRIFGTYTPQPAAGHEAMEIGVGHIRGSQVQPIWQLLSMPFVKEPGDYPLNRRFR